MALIAKYNCVARYKVKVRPTPDTLNTATQYLLAGDQFQVSEIVPDRIDPSNTTKKWGRIFGGGYDGMYTALEYPGNANPISTYTLIDPSTPPPPAPRKLVGASITLQYDDGTEVTDQLEVVKIVP